MGPGPGALQRALSLGFGAQFPDQMVSETDPGDLFMNAKVLSLNLLNIRSAHRNHF